MKIPVDCRRIEARRNEWDTVDALGTGSAGQQAQGSIDQVGQLTERHEYADLVLSTAPASSAAIAIRHNVSVVVARA